MTQVQPKPLRAPKCPSCGVVGVSHITSEPSKEKSQAGDPWFEIAFCAECGHVYGVFPRIVQAVQERH